jgi:hypothetical protein
MTKGVKMRRRDQCITLFTLLWTALILWWTSTFNIGLDNVHAGSLEATPAPTEETIVQKLPPAKVRFSVEQEIEMACDEVDCVKKCATEHQDLRKYDACRKLCAKERCRLRCKNEPNPSYVERELKREKCLDKCREKDEKCKKFCEDEAKKCKDRCKERSQRYFCVRDLDKLGQEEDEPVIDFAHFQQDGGII